MPDRRSYVLPAELATPLVARTRPEDFRVEEIPAYEPSGEGEHTLLDIEKRGIATNEAVRRLARVLHVPPREFGHAGMKDARAVTRQRISVRGVDPERVRGLTTHGVRVLAALRHGNKLQPGHLAGNRFVLVLRGIEDGALDKVRRGLAILAEKGVPHWFDAQRFGNRGDTGDIGIALLFGDWREAIELICGRASERDYGAVLEARELFDAGRLAESARAWPRSYREPRVIQESLLRDPQGLREALWRLEATSLRLYASAAQSQLFNRVLAARMPELGRLVDGDLVQFETSRGRFVVEDTAAEQPRADAFEISPTGPLFGDKEQRPRGVALALEEQVLRDAGVRREQFARRGPFYCSGSRRPLRLRAREATVEEAVDDLGRHLVLRFELPSGGYATNVLAELGQERLRIVERDEDLADPAPAERGEAPA
ncbi:MAG: tRNA pseudouridine(13) synthase TruD [Planctomycetota bacterium]